MRRNISTRNKNGFSLVELCIVIGILSILAGSIAPVFIKRIQVKAGEKTAQEISVIQQAALSYFVENAAWPADLAALKSAGYLNAAWVTNNPWQSPYMISSNANSFVVSTSVPQEWAVLITRDLPASSISGSTVTSVVPVPGAMLNASLSIGSIIIWSGTLSSIPDDWQLCDGTNGTPDLRDRFVVGARQDSGGVPMTNVSGSLTKIGGEAAHTLTIAEMPAHTHNYDGVAWQDRYDGGNWWSPCLSQTKASTSTGGGQPHNNLPPYYALCFIMKIQ